MSGPGWAGAGGGPLGAFGWAADMAQQRRRGGAGDRPTRPEWRVGDRWFFQRTALSGVTAVVAHQVVAATPHGYTVRVLGLGAETTRQWTLDLHLAQERFRRRALPLPPARSSSLADQPWERGTRSSSIRTGGTTAVRQHLESHRGDRSNRHRRGAPLCAPHGALERDAAARGLLVQPPCPVLGPAGGLSPGVRRGVGGVPTVVGVVSVPFPTAAGPLFPFFFFFFS